MTSIKKICFQFSDNDYAITFSTIFLILAGFVAWHHEMWRDEIQAWLIARDSASPIEVLYHLNRYDGHPGLWYFCLYVLKFITRSPTIMQFFHLLIAATTVYLFLRFSPFTRLQKALFPFGYLAFYEYAIIPRNYALGVLLLFLFCTLFRDWRAKFPLLGFILLLLAHTSVHALILVIAIGIALCWELIVTSDRPNRINIGIGFGFILFGVVTAVLQLKPSGPDQGFVPGWQTEFDLVHFHKVLNILPKAYFPIPQFNIHFWSSMEGASPTSEVKLVLAILILIFALVVLLRKPMALLMYLSGTIGLLAFFYTKLFGGIRHWGFLFMLFLAAIWVSHYCRDLPTLKIRVMQRFLSAVDRASVVLTKSVNTVLTFVLIIHLVGGAVAAAMDYKYPFSQGKAVARFIREAKLDDMIIAPEVPDDVTLEVLGYLEKDLFYYPRTRRFGSFIPWDVKWVRGRSLPTDDVLQEIQRLSSEKSEDILVISGRIYPEDIVARHALTEVKVFEPSVAQCLSLPIENYVLYRMTSTAQSESKIDLEAAVGIWRFDEDEGNVVQDSSAYGNDGKLVGGPKRVDGKFGKALRFDGVDDYVDCGDSKVLRVRHATMAAWIQIDTTDDSGLSAVTLPFGDGSAWEPPWRSLGLGAVQGDPFFWIAIGRENKEFSSGRLNIGQWHHMAITFDGTMRRGYLDGTEVFAYICQGEITYSGVPSCVIGVRGKDAPGEYFSGIIDEVAILNVALNGDEIRAIMKNGLEKVN